MALIDSHGVVKVLARIVITCMGAVGRGFQGRVGIFVERDGASEQRAVQVKVRY